MIFKEPSDYDDDDYMIKMTFLFMLLFLDILSSANFLNFATAPSQGCMCVWKEWKLEIRLTELPIFSYT
jgi:hypothetical protein